jgi:hypothetical protein
LGPAPAIRIVAVDFLVHIDQYLGECRLTSGQLPGGASGDPVLLVDGDPLRPGDVIESGGRMIVAALLVHEWASREGRTEQEINAARRYLSQWPAGPQID